MYAQKALLITASLLIAATAQAQSFSWQDAAAGDSVPADAGDTADNPAPTGGVTVFTDLASFQSAAPGATNTEDIEDNATGGMIQTCTEPVSSSSNDVCFTPGQFVDGLEITSSGGGGVVVLPPGFNGVPSFVMGADAFADTTIMTFTSGSTEAVGMDVYAGLAAGDVTLTVRDTSGGTIGTATATGLGALPDSQFIGVVADVPIGEIEIDGLGDNGELFDNVFFGPAMQLPPPPAIPALGPLGLTILILALAAASGIVLLRRQRQA